MRWHDGDMFIAAAGNICCYMDFIAEYDYHIIDRNTGDPLSHMTFAGYTRTFSNREVVL